MKESWYLHEGRCEGQLWCFAGLCSARTLCAIAVLGEKNPHFRLFLDPETTCSTSLAYALAPLAWSL